MRMNGIMTATGHRALSRAIPMLALLTLGACAGTTAAGPAIEVEDSWARPALAPIGHHDDHDHQEQHGQGGSKSEHGADHTSMTAHHRSSGTTTAVYLVLRNRGGEGDRLVGARTEVAGTVELHLSAIEDGVMRMRQVDAIEVPARGEARLEPGGYHLMLIGLTHALKEGDRFDLTLEFERSETRVVEVVVGVR